jgi:hypothetical protein
MTTGPPDHQNAWPAEEERLRRREVTAAEVASDAQKAGVRAQRRSVWIQAIALLFAAAAAGASAVAAFAAVNTVSTSQHIANQQAVATQLGTALTALESNSLTSQVAGLDLLVANMGTQLNAAMTDPSERQNANNSYEAALEVFDAYLRTTASADSNSTIAIAYAAKELRLTLALGPQLSNVDKGSPPLTAPSIDLSEVVLPGVNWPSINFDFLSIVYMPGIDLADAKLISSHWGDADLTDADLHCANLQDADLRHADLSGSDLSDANLSGTLLPPPAQLRKVKTTGAVGPVKGLAINHAGRNYNEATCLSDS